jgi:hypothetical protein
MTNGFEIVSTQNTQSKKLLYPEALGDVHPEVELGVDRRLGKVRPRVESGDGVDPDVVDWVSGGPGVEMTNKTTTTAGTMKFGFNTTVIVS